MDTVHAYFIKKKNKTKWKILFLKGRIKTERKNKFNQITLHACMKDLPLPFPVMSLPFLKFT